MSTNEDDDAQEVTPGPINEYMARRFGGVVERRPGVYDIFENQADKLAREARRYPRPQPADLGGIAEAAQERYKQAEQVAADTKLTAEALIQLNDHQMRLNERQRIEQKVQRRIDQLRVRAIRRYNIATIWLASIAAVGTGFAVAELGRTFGWW